MSRFSGAEMKNLKKFFDFDKKTFINYGFYPIMLYAMCLWRNWIAHLIPIQKVAGSSPVRHAILQEAVSCDTVFLLMKYL